MKLLGNRNNSTSGDDLFSVDTPDCDVDKQHADCQEKTIFFQRSEYFGENVFLAKHAHAKEDFLEILVLHFAGFV